MAATLDIVMLACLGFVACVGTMLNGMTMLVLLRNKTLYKALSSVRWLMFGQALSETLVCAIGAPLMFANILVGSAPPFTTVPVLCHSVELIGYGAGYVSLWYQAFIALKRLAAVLAPVWYKNNMQKPLAHVVLYVFPWVIGYINYAVGALVHAYHIHPAPGAGVCGANEYDESLEAATRFASYVLSDTYLHYWLPMLCGVLCYVIIYAKQRLEKLIAGRKQKRTVTVPAITPAIDTTLQVNDQRSKQREKKTKLVAIACMINIMFIFPNSFMWGFNYHTYLSEHVPAVATLFDVLPYLAFPVNPIVYILVSSDFRLAFRQFVPFLKK